MDKSSVRMPADNSLSRGRPGYGALHSSPSLLNSSSSSVRSRSAHLSPDRVTRCSGGKTDSSEVVARIPQPYRTSFSAVTKPRRIHWSTDDVLDLDSSPRLGRDGARSKARSKMGDEYVTKSDDLLSQSGRKDSPEQFHPACEAVSKDSMLSNGEDSQVECGQPNGGAAQFQRLSPRYASTPGRIHVDKKLHNGECGPLTGDSVLSDTVFSDKVSKADKLVRDFMGASTPDMNSVHIKYNTTQTSAKPPLVRKHSVADTVKIKTLITKEYVHVATVDYLKGLDRNNLPPADSETNLIILDMLREKGLLDGDSKGKSGSPDRSVGQSRALTTHSDDHLKSSGSPASVKRSLSTSIGSFLKRMSPKSIRRSFRIKGKRSSLSGSNSSSGSPYMGGAKSASETSVRIDQLTHQLDKLTLAHNDSSGSGHQSGSSGAGTPSPLPNSSARIMRSMQASVQSDSVYQSFKAKQSPHPRSIEAASLKPQALKAVEFPETSAASPSSPPLTTQSSLHPSLINPEAHSSSIQQGASTHRPAPRSLDIRQVSKLEKGVFQFPRLSMESIGQCSLDIASTHNGSPSLSIAFYDKSL